MIFFKKMMILCFFTFSFFTLTSCNKNEEKSDLESFIQIYNTYHPDSYTLEEGVYSIRTYKTTYSKDNNYTIKEQNYIGTISFNENKFYGTLSNFKYDCSEIDIKDNLIINSLHKEVYCNNNNYYEIFTDTENTITYGCKNINELNLQFYTCTSIESLARFFFIPDLLLYSREMKSFNFDNLKVEIVFEVPKYENTILEHTFTYYYDEQYNLLKAIRTSVYHIYNDDVKQHEYFYTSTLEKIDNYVSTEINMEYENEKNFQPEDLSFTF